MKIIISKAELLRTVKPVAKAAASGKSAKPIYEHVLFAAADDLLNLYGGDGRVFLSAASKAEVKEEGQIAVNAADLLKRLDTMPDGPLVIASESVNGVVNAFSLRSQTSARKHQYPCIDGADFPEQPGLSDGVRVTVGSAKLRTLLERVKHAATEDAGRFTDFIKIGSTGTQLYAVATNGFQMVRATAECVEPIDAFDSLLSIAASDRIISVLGDTGDVDLTITDRHFCASVDCFDVQCTVGAVAWPTQWVQNFDGDFSDTFEINAAQLIDAIRAVRLSAEEKQNSIALAVASGVLYVTGASADKGSSTDEIPGVEYGDTGDVKVNVDNLKSMIEASKCERIRMYMSGSKSNMHVRAFGTGYESVLMGIPE